MCFSSTHSASGAMGHQSSGASESGSAVLGKHEGGLALCALSLHRDVVLREASRAAPALLRQPLLRTHLLDSLHGVGSPVHELK